MLWALERATNPSVLIVHATAELTRHTIETCPPARAPAPLDSLLLIQGVRSVDLHRYRARMNLMPGTHRDRVWEGAERALSGAWGPRAALPPRPEVRAFPVRHEGARLVAESVEMAGADPTLRALFEIDGVAEVVMDHRQARVRLAPLFSWSAVEGSISEALRGAGT